MPAMPSGIMGYVRRNGRQWVYRKGCSAARSWSWKWRRNRRQSFQRFWERCGLIEKGLLKRLADFWRKAGPELESGARWLWRTAGSTKKLREDAEGRGFPFGETAGTETFLQGRTFAGGQEGNRQTGRRFPFAEGFRGKGQGLFTAGETLRQTEWQNRQMLFLAEENNAPQKTEQLSHCP